MDDAVKAALIAYLEAQVLSANTLLAELAGGPVAEPAPPRRGPGRPKKAAPAPVEEQDEDDDDDTDEGDEDNARRTELEAMKITALKALAIKRGFQAAGVKEATKPELIEAILEDESKDDEDDESDDEDDDEGGEVNYTREELTAMGIRRVKALAYEQGHTVADLKGLKLDEVIDVMLEEGDAEEDSDEEDGDEDDGGFYTREDYEKMSLAELKVIAKAYQKDDPSFKVPAVIKKPALIDLLMEGYE